MNEREKDLPLVKLERADWVFNERHSRRETKKLVY